MPALPRGSPRARGESARERLGRLHSGAGGGSFLRRCVRPAIISQQARNILINLRIPLLLPAPDHRACTARADASRGRHPCTPHTRSAASEVGSAWDKRQRGWDRFVTPNFATVRVFRAQHGAVHRRPRRGGNGRGGGSGKHGHYCSVRPRLRQRRCAAGRLLGGLGSIVGQRLGCQHCRCPQGHADPAAHPEAGQRRPPRRGRGRGCLEESKGRAGGGGRRPHGRRPRSRWCQSGGAHAQGLAHPHGL